MMWLIWGAALTALGLWSLGAWGVHALLGQIPSDWGSLGAWVDKLPPSALMERWFPLWQDGLKWLLSLAETGLSWAGGAAEVMSWAVWLIWGFGALFLLGTAALVSLVVVMVRRHAARPVPV